MNIKYLKRQFIGIYLAKVSIKMYKYYENGRKYYTIRLQKTIFGGISVVCSWGRRDIKRGNYKTLFPEEKDLHKIIDRVHNVRLKRGYSLIEVKV